VDCNQKKRAVDDSRVAPGPRAASVEAVASEGDPVVEHDGTPCCPDASGVAGVSLGAGAWGPDDLELWFDEKSEFQ